MGVIWDDAVGVIHGDDVVVWGWLASDGVEV